MSILAQQGASSMLRRKAEGPHPTPFGHTSISTHRPVLLCVGNVKCVAVEVGGEQEWRKSWKEKFITGDIMNRVTTSAWEGRVLNSCSIWRTFHVRMSV